MAEGITSFEGNDVPDGVSTADMANVKTSSGGPIEVADGLDDGSSTTVPAKTANMVDSPKNSSGSIISGPMED